MPSTAELPITAYTSAADARGTIIYISPQVAALLGYEPSALTNRPGAWLRLMHQDDRKRVIPLLAQACCDGVEFSTEYRLRHRDGAYRWIHDQARVIRGGRGSPLYTQGVWIDVTDRKDSEVAYARMARQLERSNAELRQFISIASHELQAPLRRATNFADLLQAKGKHLDQDALALIKGVKNSVAEMHDLVSGLAHYSEVGQEAREVKPVSPAKVLRGVLADLSPALGGCAGEVSVGDLPPVRAEPDRLAQVFYHLLDNAIKFRSGAPPRVRISATTAGSDAVFSVRDNGIGIEPRQVDRLFTLGERLHPKRRFSGAGMSLAICRRIIEKFGGRIWVESEPGAGSTFRFSLPAAGEAAS